MKDAVVIAEYVYPETNHTCVWLFNQLSCHKAFADDALNARHMNVQLGGGGGGESASNEGYGVGDKSSKNGHG